MSTTTDNRFEDRLLSAILSDFESLREPTKDRRGIRNQKAATSPRKISFALTGVAAAALAVFGFSFLAGRTPAATSGNIQTVSYVVQHVEAALLANNDVVVETQHAPDSQTGLPTFTKSWSTAGSAIFRSETLDSAGSPVTGNVVTSTPGLTTSVVINYQRRTWSMSTYRDANSSPAAAPLTLTQLTSQRRADVADGSATLVDPSIVDGRSVLELEQGSSATGFQYTWVDPSTYLPIRAIDTAPGVSATSDQAIRVDYQWLANSPANLELLTVGAALPAGFSQVPPATTNG